MVKGIVAHFIKEKALAGAFSMIVKSSRRFVCSYNIIPRSPWSPGSSVGMTCRKVVAM